MAWPENVRLANEDDVDALVELAPVLPDHQARAPVFGRTGRPRQTEDELRADLLEDMAKPEIGELVVEQDGRIVGAFDVVPVELSRCSRRPRTARGRGLPRVGSDVP